MRAVLVSVHHPHGHSGVVIGDEGPLLARDLRAAAAGWSPLLGDRPELIVWPDGHAVAGGLLPEGAARAELVTGGRRAAAVVGRGAWIAAVVLDPPPTGLPVRFLGADGAEVARAVAGA